MMTLSTTEWRIVAGALAICALIVFFPPWLDGSIGHGVAAFTFVGHAPLWSPPEPEYAVVRISYEQIVFEWLAIAMAAMSFVIIGRTRRHQRLNHE